MKTKKVSSKTKAPLPDSKVKAAGKSGRKGLKKSSEETEENQEDTSVILQGSIGALPPKGQLEKLFVDGLKDIYWAEKQTEKLLLKMGAEATSEELRKAFKDHRLETEDHISRVEEIFEMLGENAEAVKCEAIDGISRELDHFILETRENTFTRDSALILGGLKVEHFEIASYSGLIQLAKALGKTEIADLLTDTLEEEKEAASQLSYIAEDVVYEHAIID